MQKRMKARKGNEMRRQLRDGQRKSKETIISDPTREQQVLPCRRRCRKRRPKTDSDEIKGKKDGHALMGDLFPSFSGSPIASAGLEGRQRPIERRGHALLFPAESPACLKKLADPAQIDTRSFTQQSGGRRKKAKIIIKLEKSDFSTRLQAWKW